MREPRCIQCGTDEDVSRHTIFDVLLCESEHCHDVVATWRESWTRRSVRR